VWNIYSLLALTKKELIHKSRKPEGTPKMTSSKHYSIKKEREIKTTSCGLAGTSEKKVPP